MPTTKNRAKSQAVLVAVCEAKNETKFTLLEKTLEKAGFWRTIETERKIAKTPRKKFQILIKPDLEIYDPGAPTGTDPQLVEHLIDLLFERGYQQIQVADGLSSSDVWLENRDVVILADLIGYRFVTDNGNEYEVLNLSEDLTELPVPQKSVLHGTKLARCWTEAQFRINMPKNKTDEENRYALGLHNLIGVLPLREKEYHYRNRLRVWEVGTDLLQHTDIHFTIIDAYTSNHGCAGARTVKPLSTNCFIASSDLLLADWIGALKMDVDPYTSRLNAKALRNIGLPEDYKIIGDVSPYDKWINVSLLLSESVQKRNDIPIVNRTAKPWLQSVNKELFPYKYIVDEQINSFLTKYLSNIDDHPLAYWATITLNYMLSGIHNSLESWKILYDKDNLYKREVSLGIDLQSFSPEDYEAVINYMSQLAQIINHTPKDRNGLRWRYLDKSVLFKFSRILPISYEDFVSKVPVNRAVQLMYDNIGGACVPVSFDKQKRVIRQAERNIYLPQPNWMALFGGKTIDVGKIETIKYKQNQQQIFWRTVVSENDSATFDDGIVTFKKDPGGTEVTIVARQKFTLPLIWQVIDLDYIPEIKDALVSNAYVTFFSRTLANYEAAYEGRDTILGLDWSKDFGETGEDFNRLYNEKLLEIFSLFSGIFEQWAGNGDGLTSQKKAKEDEMGYRHFVDGNSTVNNQIQNLTNSFLSDMIEAFKRDVRFVSESAERDNQ